MGEQAGGWPGHKPQGLSAPPQAEGRGTPGRAGKAGVWRSHRLCGPGVSRCWTQTEGATRAGASGDLEQHRRSWGRPGPAHTPEPRGTWGCARTPSTPDRRVLPPVPPCPRPGSQRPCEAPPTRGCPPPGHASLHAAHRCPEDGKQRPQCDGTTSTHTVLRFLSSHRRKRRAQRVAAVNRAEGTSATKRKQHGSARMSPGNTVPPLRSQSSEGTVTGARVHESQTRKTRRHRRDQWLPGAGVGGAGSWHRIYCGADDVFYNSLG